MTASFVPGAQQVLAIARKEADELDHEYIGTEHILLAILRLGRDSAFRVLQNMVVDSDAIRIEIWKEVPRGSTPKMAGGAVYTAAVKKALALSGRAAKSLNHCYIGTEHLLLGIIEEGGVAAQVLERFGVNYDRARLEILKDIDPNFTPAKRGTDLQK